MKLDLDVLNAEERTTLRHTLELGTNLIDVCTEFINSLPEEGTLHDWPIQARHALMRVVPPDDHSAATEDRVRAVGMALLLLEAVINLDRHTTSDKPDLQVVPDG